MKIIVSADCFSSFTSGFPVRGMMLQLIKKRSNDTFVLYYTNRPTPTKLDGFYKEINSLPNVEVRYFKYSRRMVALRRLLHLPLIEQQDDVSVFINPGRPEFWPNIKVPHICSIADFSTLKGLSTGKYAWFYKYFNRLDMRYLFDKIDTIVPISYYTEKDLIEFWPKHSSKTKVVHNGIDNMWFDEKLDTTPDLFNGEPYFIWWGLISRRKNVINLIKSYKSAKSENPQLPNLLLVGGIEPYMSDITTEFNDTIINIPFQDNYILKTLVRKSSGLIFPSFYEGFGLPVIEAFSQGINVACSCVSSLPEVADGKAKLFNPNSLDEMKQAIIDLWKKPLDANVLMDYSQKFTYSEASRKYSDLIDSVV